MKKTQNGRLLCRSMRTTFKKSQTAIEGNRVPDRGVVNIMMIKVFLFFGATFFIFCNIPLKVHASSEYHFSTPPGLESQFIFWVKIYSKYTSDNAVVHDANNLGIVYEVLYLGGSAVSDHEKVEKLKKAKEKYRKILQNLGSKKNKSVLKGEEKRVHDLVGNGFNRASKNLRIQMGQKNNFEKGLVRSGQYIDEIKKILASYGLPEELSVLPQIRSFYKDLVNNSVDAVGIWQLNRKRGRQLMRVRDDIDERWDPLLSTHAAAKILKENFQVFKSWALAITAFHHGKGRMVRAKQTHGNNLVDIIKNNKSRTFGFGPKNFYAKFLAAYYVTTQKKRYFPNIKNAQQIKYASFRLEDYIHISTIVDHFSMSLREIALANPALLKPVISGNKRIPRGFVFKMPEDKVNSRHSFYRVINDSEKFEHQIQARWHTVQKGDTLSELSLRYGTSIKNIKRVNNIGSEGRIYQGKKIRLPWNLASYKPRNGFYSPKNRHSTFSSIPSLLPVQGLITSTFGIRKSPISGLRGKHEGLDIGAPRGSFVRVTADGLVVFSGKKSGYGNMIEVAHGNGIVTRYGHNFNHLVSVGDRVRQGEIIATVGNTGRSTGPHLHYEVHVNRVPVNPENFIPQD